MSPIIQTIKSVISAEYALIQWKDFLEIAFLSSFFYYCARWLQTDTYKNLLPPFYGYLLILITAHVLELKTIFLLLFIFSPAIAMLFMMMHQSLLQQNFVSLKNIVIQSPPQTADWLSILMKTILKMLSLEKDILCIIEHTDSLQSLLTVSEPLDVPITEGLISLLLTQLYEPQKLCWISSSGYIRGINAQFKASWHPSSYQNKEAWIDDAIAYTTKIDAIILFAQSDQHTFSLAYHGSIIKGLSMEQAHLQIKKLINYSVSLPNKGISHGVTQSKRFAQRST